MKKLAILGMILLLFSCASAAQTCVEQDGNVRRTWYEDEEGNLAFSRTTGYALMVQTLDEAGHALLEQYYDTTEQPVPLSSGQFGVERVYNEAGQNIRYTYLDAQGKPKRISSGYVSVRREYNAENRVEYEWYEDEKGTLCLRSDGYCGVYKRYDEKGQNIQSVYLDETGKPTRNSSGIVAVMRVYNEAGKAEYEWYYDENDCQVQCWGGYYGVHRKYNEAGQNTESTYLDREGSAVANTSGYATLRQTFDPDGKVDTQMYFDTEGNPAALSSGEYGIRKEYDVQGRSGVSTYLNAQGAPMTGKLGYASVKREYDLEGNLYAEYYLDLNREPATSGRGQYGQRLVYENGTCVQQIPLGKNGKDLVRLDLVLSQNQWTVFVGAAVVVLLSLSLGRKGQWALLAAYLLFICYMTLLVRESGERDANMTLFWSYRQFLTSATLRMEVLNNVLLFLPLGAILFAIYPRPVIILAAAGVSLAVEGTQYVLGLGLCELDDLFGNTLGGAIGWCIASACRGVELAAQKAADPKCEKPEGGDG